MIKCNVCEAGFFTQEGLDCHPCIGEEIMKKLEMDEKTRADLDDVRRDRDYKAKEEAWLNSERMD
jgi:hypothetical protein